MVHSVNDSPSVLMVKGIDGPSDHKTSMTREANRYGIISVVNFSCVFYCMSCKIFHFKGSDLEFRPKVFTNSYISDQIMDVKQAQILQLQICLSNPVKGQRVQELSSDSDFC